MVETLLKVEDLKVHFPIKKGIFSRTSGYVYAVDGVSFSLGKGETIGLVGESGCGKTTTGLAILRLIEATSGKVFFKGQDVFSFTKSQMRFLKGEIQFIFQDPYSSLNPRMTVNQILGDPMEIHGVYRGGEKNERIAYLLEKVGLTPEQGRRYPHEFSGGQRQRIGIARALALNPRIIIGDEPVSALDVSIQAQIINLLIDLQEEFNHSYIIIAHDLAVVEHICDRIVVMYLGKIVESAPYGELYTDPKHPYTQALLSAVPVTHPKQSKNRIILEGDVPNPINPPTGCSFHPRCPRRFEGCDRYEPELKTIQDRHQVACHLF
ncbi:MAG: dipeptide ABC transporter ATP-binding protein [Deltaproteobacteria bacterium]|nr:dipeptide ABC transporter ATP-binding protein [Deltaproteobacteria bacterium]MBW2304117.1 dipeptide ABC transporter ATP-binding protein [Deltaproteobacteria bacterium]